MWQGDYHTHSTLDDGKSTLEEMAAAAHALGLPRLGFSGHSWCPWEEDYCCLLYTSHRKRVKRGFVLSNCVKPFEKEKPRKPRSSGVFDHF